MVAAIERYRGAFVGAAAGDVLGAPHEGINFSRPAGIEAVLRGLHVPVGDRAAYGTFIRQVQEDHGGVVSEVMPPPNSIWGGRGAQTDDTAQAVAVAQGILDAGGYNMDAITSRLLEWFDAGKAKGMGITTHLGLNLIRQGRATWQDAGSHAKEKGAVYRGTLQKGLPTDGSLMRAYPLGLLFSGNPERIHTGAAELSGVTHAFEECVEACQIVSQIVGGLALGQTKEAVLDFVEHNYPHTYTKALQTVRHDFAYAGGALTALGVALTAFKHYTTFRDTVVAAANPHICERVRVTQWDQEGLLGPDTDTYAAVAGAMAGAAYGLTQVPAEWTDCMHPVSREQLVGIADRIYDVARLTQ